VLRDLGQAGADVSLELSISSVDERGEEGHGTGVHHDLGKLGGVLADLGERGSRDPLERNLGLLDTEDQEGDRASVRNGLGEVEGVPRGINQSLGKSHLAMYARA